MPAFDTLTVGNALIDAFLTLEDHDSVHLDRQANELCVKAGEKIHLESCIFELGGNACNVAVGLSRLGLRTAILAEIGEDEFSEKIMNRLKRERVNTEHVKRKGQSSFAIGLNYQKERTLFIEHVEREHNFSLRELHPESIYLTSIGREWRPVYQRVREYVRSHQVIFALNPGTTQLEEGAGFIRELLPLTDLLFLNREEALRLIGRESAKIGMREILSALTAHGARTVVLTDGKNGSYVTDMHGLFYHAGILHVPVVERTGSGDAYATGFLAAILQGKDITQAMRWGTVNSSAVIGQVGAQPGLLTRSEMEEQTEDETQVFVKEI